MPLVCSGMSEFSDIKTHCSGVVITSSGTIPQSVPLFFVCLSGGWRGVLPWKGANSPAVLSFSFAGVLNSPHNYCLLVRSPFGR